MLVHRKQERSHISALIFKDDNPVFVNGIIADNAAAGYVIVGAQIILNSYLHCLCPHRQLFIIVGGEDTDNGCDLSKKSVISKRSERSYTPCRRMFCIRFLLVPRSK